MLTTTVFNKYKYYVDTGGEGMNRKNKLISRALNVYMQQTEVIYSM